MRKRDSEHACPVRAESDRHPPSRRRQKDSVLDVLELTFECDVLPGKQPSHDLERLLETRDGPVKRKPERAKFRLVPSRAEPERGSATRDLVDRRGHSRDRPRSVKSGGSDERTEPDPRRDHRERGELRPRVPRSPLRPSAAPIEHVIADPDRLESGLFRGPRDRGHLGPPDLALHLGQLDPYAHGIGQYRELPPPPPTHADLR